MRLFYRLQQFWQTATAEPLSAAARRDVAAVLSDREMTLFTRYDSADAQHAWQVLATLQQAGHRRSQLLVAALLHDVGKTRVELSVWDRSLVVALGKLLPGRAARWSRGRPLGWRKAFVVKAKHPQWGAEMAAAAGSDPLAVRLIRRHQDPLPPVPGNDEERLLFLLQQADDQN